MKKILKKIWHKLKYDIPCKKDETDFDVWIKQPGIKKIKAVIYLIAFIVFVYAYHKADGEYKEKYQNVNVEKQYEEPDKH